MTSQRASLAAEARARFSGESTRQATPAAKQIMPPPKGGIRSRIPRTPALATRRWSVGLFITTKKLDSELLVLVFGKYFIPVVVANFDFIFREPSDGVFHGIGANEVNGCRNRLYFLRGSV